MAAQTEPAEHPTSFGVSNTKMGMWALIGSECLFFGALITTYLLYVSRLNDGPGPREVFDIPFTSISTFILLMSSLAMVLALSAIQQGDMRRFRVWILGTALLGLTFMGGQLFEFTEFVTQKGFGLTTSPFSTSFFVLTSFHKAHVLVGVVMLLGLWVGSFTGHVRPSAKHSEAVENVGLYWHFVDIVWIILFTVVYLIPAEG